MCLPGLLPGRHFSLLTHTLTLTLTHSRLILSIFSRYISCALQPTTLNIQRLNKTFTFKTH